jgi:transposase
MQFLAKWAKRLSWKEVNKAIDEVRVQEARDLKTKGLAPTLTHSRWCLLKRPENLTAKQEIKLSDLLRYNLKAIRSYLLKEDFQFFWDYVSPHWAGIFLDRWCRRTIKSRIKPMQKVARMLGSHRELLLNWFRAFAGHGYILPYENIALAIFYTCVK